MEAFGDLKGRIVSYIGDGNNVALSLMKVVTKLGAHFRIANPENFGLKEDDIKQSQQFAQLSGGSITQYRDPSDAVEDADVIYTDTWTSMGQEEEAKMREEVFPPYQVNRNLVDLAKPEVIVMHCLPAHRGQEITDEVADGSHSRLFVQAENRMHAQKAILINVFK
jgi:ornithine carbamoyltransferase